MKPLSIGSPAVASQPVRIVLVDDHVLIRSAFRCLLETSGWAVVVGEAEDGEDGVAKIAELSPDIALVDIGIPRLNGIEVTRRVVSSGSITQVIAVTAAEDAVSVKESLQAGASGYLPKSAAAPDLVAAVRTVRAGTPYVHPSLLGRLLELGLSPHDERKDGLSERESDVLRLIALGYSNKEIGAQLDVSVKTVETYKARAAEKIQATSRVDIVRYAASRGWICG